MPIFKIAVVKVKEDIKMGVKILKETINILKFADYIAVRAESEQDLTTIVEKMENVAGNEFNMRINKI